MWRLLPVPGVVWVVLWRAECLELDLAVVDPCHPNPCQNFGECFVSPEGEMACICAKGFEGDLCEENFNECTPRSCANGGTCVDLVRGVRCDCPFGFYGRRCEGAEFWTLQQWRAGSTCLDVPWRCFRLQLGHCINTGHSEAGRLGDRVIQHYWYGRLNEESGNFTLALCFGPPIEHYELDEGNESGTEGQRRRLLAAGGTADAGGELTSERGRSHGGGRWDVPDNWCNCGSEFAGIPRFGVDGLGPFLTRNNGTKDSAECHRLLRRTPSHLTLSTGAAWSKGRERDRDITDIDCRPSGSPTTFRWRFRAFCLSVALSWLREVP